MTRQEAIRIIETVFQDEYVYKYYDSVTHQALNMAIEALSAEAVQGGWVIEDAHTEHCSVCGYAFHTSALFAVGGNDEPNFCPHCGARMKGGDDE